MANYVDGFVFPIDKTHLDEYREVALQIAEIWKEHGALSYQEFVGDDLNFEGVRSFLDVIELKENEVVVFGWMVFPSKEVRDQANKDVPNDSRMSKIEGPLMNPERLIFDASRMVYGGFKSLVSLSSK